MGNYNKWRKLLTILLIINMCFVLFARLTRVFGYSGTFYSIPIVDTSGIYIESQDITVNTFDYDSAEYSLYTLVLNGSVSSSSNVACILITCKRNETVTIKPAISSSSGFYYLFFDAPSGVSILQIGGTYSYLNTNIANQVQRLANSSFTLTHNLGVFQQSSLNNINTLYPSTLKYSSNSYLILKDSDDNVIDDISPYSAPSFNNVTEIENGNPDGVFISPSSYGVDDTLYFHLLEVVYSTPNSNNDTIFYYLPKIFALNGTSSYIRYYLENEDDPYYYISRKELGLSPDSSYLYVLSNSSESYNNSVGIIQEDISSGVYDVVSSDTTGILSYQETIDDNIDNIDDFLRDNSVGEYNLNYNNNNSELTSMNNGFFSRLLSLVSDTFDYELGDDTVITIPMPHSNKTIDLHSNILYNNVNGVIRTIIEAFWFYIFGFYVFRFINKLYIAISSGSILDTFSSSDEAITNNML